MANPTPPSPTIANSTTLSAIETKVRRLTRSPSTAQLSQADLDNYINTFVVYDFPEHLRTFNLRTPFSFICNPYQDVYPTDKASFGGVTTNPLYNFQNLYLTVHPPFYVSGYQSFFTQSREQMFGIYPLVNSIQFTGNAGDGVTTLFTGTIPPIQQATLLPNQVQQSAVLLKNNVLFDSVDVNGNGVSLVDTPIIDSVTGNPTIIGALYNPNTPPATPIVCTAPYTNTILNPQFLPYVDNTINYLTGVYTINFSTAPGAGYAINSQTVPTVVSIPQAVLFYNNQFTVRPVPDQPYKINFEVYQRPTALLTSGQSPELEEYWQLIAYGAARKIFQDRMDLDSVALVEPEYQKQMTLCLRRTIVQNTNERTATIYTEQTSFGAGNGWGWGSGGGNF